MTDLTDHSKMPFGAYKDHEIGLVPFKYWRWFLEQSWSEKWPAVVTYANSRLNPKQSSVRHENKTCLE